MTLPVLRPGQTHGAVPKFKRALVEELQSRNHRELASAIRLDSKTYGPTTVRATKRMQHNRQLEPDGIVGDKTWRALGFHEPVVDERPPVLHGVPFEPGLLAVDGRYVDKPLGQTILAERRARHWHGVVNSGYRPAWYQKRLWDEAVKKYGSEPAASKWVSPRPLAPRTEGWKRRRRRHERRRARRRVERNLPADGLGAVAHAADRDARHAGGAAGDARRARADRSSRGGARRARHHRRRRRRDGAGAA